MTSTTANQYLQTKVLTASPAELRMLLIEGAIRFATQGRDGLAERDHEKTFEGFSQAKAILMEMITALRPEVDAELCENLSALYTYMYQQLVEANLEKNTALADEVIKLLEYERETWSLLLDKLAEEKISTTEAGPASAPPTKDAGDSYTPLSIEG
jgi:flagellar secretion chaperone FliS